MSELTTRLRQILIGLSASDPRAKRFGASRHRYALLPPIDDSSLTRLGLALPDDYVEYVTRLSAGGVGPYYGLVPVDRAAAFSITAPAGIAAWRRALPIADLGCGYAAVLALDGPAAGQIWIDARAVGMVEPIRASFTAFYLDWIDRVAHNRWLDGFVPPGQCALTTALTGYFDVCEQRLSIPAGTLAGDALREALAALGPSAIEIAAQAPVALFHPGERVDPCVTCARVLQGLAEQGLRGDVVAPGVPPLPAR